RNTALDQDAHKRATSVYLIQRIVPMLPLAPSEELCRHEDYQEVVWQDHWDSDLEKYEGGVDDYEQLDSDGSGESSATDIDSDVEDENPLE
ncbi:hypothetical protein EW146_g10510, partial [Bondarzewia mesenterica]